MLVLGHRGYVAGSRPENTGPAVAAALHGGADGVEVDVRLSADGVLICCHDPDLSRVAGVPVGVATSTAADLRRRRLAGGHRLATLAEVVTVASGWAGCRVVVEVKPVRTAARAEATAQALRQTLSQAGSTIDIAVSSFDHDLLDFVRHPARGVPQIRTALLGKRLDPPGPSLRRALAEGHEELHLHRDTVLASPWIVSRAGSLGVAITCWTVNRRRDLCRIARLGIDAVITDDPIAARAAVIVPPVLRYGRPTARGWIPCS